MFSKEMFKMIDITYNFLVLGLLQIQLIQSQNRFCPEAVRSIQFVKTCPTSKTEWDSAALKKNCSKLATRQNCVSINKFKYHCVINGLRNKLVEVCAPERIIFGHCVEFNTRGGVIQDQKSALCNETFPKCDKYYFSTDAYKYPDCYMLVSKDKAIWLTPEDTFAKLTTMRTITDESLSLQKIITITAILTAVFISVPAVVLFICKKRRMRSRMKTDESIEEMFHSREIYIKHEDTFTDDTVGLKKKMNSEYDNTDDEEKIEKEDELAALLKTTKLNGTSHIRRRFSTNDFSTYNTLGLVSLRHRRNYSAGF